VDIYSDDLELEPYQAPLTKQQRRSARVKARLHRNNFREQLTKLNIDVSMLFETDSDLIQMRRKFSKEFFETFEKGFKLYVEGDWKKARKELMKVAILKGMKDKPSENILEFMASHDNQAPQDWTGIRYEE